ncbi:MAG: ATP-binding protein, partial [Evtepia sp.]
LRKKNQALQAERAELLRAHGYPENALEDIPICAACGDSGWCGTTMCNCLKALCTEEQIAELSSLLDLGEQSFSKFRFDFYDPPYRPRMERIFDICKDYAKNFGHTTVRNLFLCGGTGLGKTFLSACIARDVSTEGYSVVYDTAGSIFARFEEQKFSKDENDAREARSFTRKYLRCDLLILDDLGSELTTPFVQSALYQVVNTRMTERRHTVISSNLTMAEVRARYTPQIVSRLDGEYQILPFEGRDIRLIKNRIQKTTPYD